MSEETKHGSGPPIPRLQESYLLFKKEVRLWAVTTTVDTKRQAGTLLFKLPDKAKKEAIELSVQVLQDGRTETVDGDEKKTSGVDCLLEKLDEIYLEDISKEKFKCYDRFRTLKRKEGQSTRDYILDFERAVSNLKEHDIALPTAVLAYELLRSCNVSDYKYSMAVAIVGELTYEHMKETVKKITELQDPQDRKEESMFLPREGASGAYYAHNSETGLASEFDIADTVQDTYYNRSRGGWRYRGARRGMSSSRGYSRGQSASKMNKRTNPKDRDGNVMACNICQSIYHFARQCPEMQKGSSTQYFSEDIALFQNLHDTSEPNIMDRFTRDNFGLAVLDTGCNTTVCGKKWLDVYIDTLDKTGQESVSYREKEVNFRFGDNDSSRSSVQCTFPAIVCGKRVKIISQVVEDQIPLLISKQSMKNASMILNFKDDTVQAFGFKQKILFTETGHCSIPLSNMNVHQEICMCSTDNIVLHTGENMNPKKMAEKLHKQFAHPPAESLKTLVRAAGKLTKELSSEISEVSQHCEVCRRYKQPSNRPVVCMPLAKDFNDTVAMDIKVFDQGKGIYFQHMIDHKTRFSSAKMVRSKEKETVVKSVFTNWISVFGPPKKFMSDNGGEYVNSSFMDMCEKFDVHIVTTGAEAPWSNGLIERHHALLARNVDKIIEDTHCSIEIALAWAVHAKNSLSNINGFSPYQLLFGKNPVLKSVSDPYVSPTVLEDESPSETVAKNISAIYAARRAQMSSEADEKIRRAMRSKTREVYSENITSGDFVYYKRNESKKWRGPASVIGTDGKLVFVRHGGYTVRCHRARVVKVNDLYSQESSDKSDSDPPHVSSVQNNSLNEFKDARELMEDDVLVEEEEVTATEIPHQPDQIDDPDLEVTGSDQSSTAMKQQKLCEVKSKLEKKKLTIGLTNQDPFREEKQNEVEKWKKNHVYDEVQINDVQENITPISTRWVTTEEGDKRKARLVARGFEEEPLASTDTVSPTCRKESLRLLFTITSSLQWSLRSLDIASAFLQGKDIEREVYIIPPKEFHKPGIIWKLRKCVYGLSDAAKMWYSNVRQQVESAGLTKCLFDDALFFSRAENNITGLMTVHVDDFIYAGTNSFQSTIKDHILEGFQIKAQGEQSFSYLGLEVYQDESTHEITVGQCKYIKDLMLIQLSPSRKSQKSNPINPSEYGQLRSGIGQLLWLSLQTRPDIAFQTCQLSNNLKDPNVADLLLYNKMVKNLQQNPDIPLRFQNIPNMKEATKLLVYSDAAYGNLSNSGSQCGYLILITDKDETVRNPVTWKSVKLDRVCSSTLAAESLALLKAVDHALFIQQTLKQMLGPATEIKIQCYVDNKGLLELVNKTKDPTEKRLIVTMASLREMIEREEITVAYIPSKKMPADVLTKRGPSGDVLQSYLENV